MKYINLILITIFFTNLNAQSIEIIVPFSNNGKWGFMNINKEIVVFPQFEEAYPQANGLCRVKKNGKYGFINSSGKIKIKIKYDIASDFENGIAKVTRKGKTKYIKTNSKKNNRGIALCGNHRCLLPSFQESITIYDVGKKKGIYRSKWSNIDTLPPIFDSIIPISHQLMYLIKDSKGDFLHEGSFGRYQKYFKEAKDFKYQDIKLFNCDMCKTGYSTTIGVKEEGLWGYMEVYIMPDWQIKPKYLAIEVFNNGFGLVEYEKDKFGYVDYQGNEYFFR